MSKAGKQRRFNPRAFTSLTLAVAFGIAMVAGLVLYITPQGRVANWIDWRVLGLGKEQWGAVHMTGSLLFVAMAVFHLIYNWKALLAYLRRKAKESAGLRWEPVAALAIGLLFVVGTVQQWQPFQSVIDINSATKRYWEAKADVAPRPHAEEMTLAAYAEDLGMHPEGLLMRLAEAGLDVQDPQEKLGSMAARHGMAPSEIHALVGPGPGAGMGSGEGPGHGDGQGRGMRGGEGRGRSSGGGEH